ncbi:MAG: GFA family protein [Roseobacter sp.]
MEKIEGGCLCGAVRYKSDAEPVMQAVCHCKTCQKLSGSTYSFNVAVPAESLVVTGDVATYEDHSGTSGQAMLRRFCPKCGSSLYGGGALYGPLLFIKAGSLDDASWVAPDLHIWAEEKLPWTPIPDGATVVNQNPG